MNITIINDCRDDNAKGRQVARASSLIGGAVSFIGVANDLEAAGNLIDTLDAYGEGQGTIIVNVAPRNGHAKKWPNGTPFCYFWYKNILVLSSIDGLALSLVKKLKLVPQVFVMDIPEVTKFFASKNLISPEMAEYISNSQFRSYDFLPRAAAYLFEHKDVLNTSYAIADVADAPLAIWWIDNFGNCKSTMLREDVKVLDGKAETLGGLLPYFERLKDVPDKTAAIITGSSGLGDKRFLEIVAQGESAAKKFNLSTVSAQ